MNIIKQKKLTIEPNTINKIKCWMYLVFIFLMSQIYPYILWKKIIC